jgi:hypothetical protein
MRMIAMVALRLMPSLACTREATPPPYDASAAMSDGWSVAAPANEGLDSNLICAIGPSLKKTQEADPDGAMVCAGHVERDSVLDLQDY